MTEASPDTDLSRRLTTYAAVVFFSAAASRFLEPREVAFGCILTAVGAAALWIDGRSKRASSVLVTIWVAMVFLLVSHPARTLAVMRVDPWRVALFALSPAIVISASACWFMIACRSWRRREPSWSAYALLFLWALAMIATYRENWATYSRCNDRTRWPLYDVVVLIPTSGIIGAAALGVGLILVGALGYRRFNKNWPRVFLAQSSLMLALLFWGTTLLRSEQTKRIRAGLVIPAGEVAPILDRSELDLIKVDYARGDITYQIQRDGTVVTIGDPDSNESYWRPLVVAHPEAPVVSLLTLPIDLADEVQIHGVPPCRLVVHADSSTYRDLPELVGPRIRGAVGIYDREGYGFWRIGFPTPLEDDPRTISEYVDGWFEIFVEVEARHRGEEQ